MTARVKDEAKREELKAADEVYLASIKVGETDYPCNQQYNQAGVLMRTDRPMCATGYCCGGADNGIERGEEGSIVIETCQSTTVVTYEYQAPRSRLATANPAKVAWPFACIEGAQNMVA